MRWETYAYVLGERIRRIRRSQDMTQEELAAATGLDRNSISYLENGRNARANAPSNPKLQTIYLIARALRVPPIALLPDVGSDVEDQAPSARLRGEEAHQLAVHVTWVPDNLASYAKRNKLLRSGHQRSVAAETNTD